MLPPELASLCFVDSDLGSDAALAERAHAALPEGRVMLLGAARPGLVRALAGARLDLVVVDSSRTALRRLRDELSGDPTALLLAADPRELEIPGGVDAMLVSSALWRAVLLDTDRRHVLRGMSKELRENGLLLLELERLPRATASWSPLRSTEPGAEWRSTDANASVAVRRGGEDARFATFSPETAIQEALDEGFAAVTALSTRTSEPADADSDLVWATLRTTRGIR